MIKYFSHIDDFSTYTSYAPTQDVYDTFKLSNPNTIQIATSDTTKNKYIYNDLLYDIPDKPDGKYIFNYNTGTWVYGRNLSEAQVYKWEEIKKNRSAVEYGGFTWDGSIFDSDTVSVQRITGSVLLAQLIPDYEVEWTLADNTTRTLTASDILQVAAALGAHVKECFDHAKALRDLINNATTIAEVEAITWSTNV